MESTQTKFPRTTSGWRLYLIAWAVFEVGFLMLGLTVSVTSAGSCFNGTLEYNISQVLHNTSTNVIRENIVPGDCSSIETESYCFAITYVKNQQKKTGKGEKVNFDTSLPRMELVVKVGCATQYICKNYSGLCYTVSISINSYYTISFFNHKLTDISVSQFINSNIFFSNKTVNKKQYSKLYTLPHYYGCVYCT